jgi:hypothetical protein
MTRIGEIEEHTKFWLERLNARDNLGYLDVNERIIFKWILKK